MGLLAGSPGRAEERKGRQELLALLKQSHLYVPLLRYPYSHLTLEVNILYFVRLLLQLDKRGMLTNNGFMQGLRKFKKFLNTSQTKFICRN